MSDSISMDEQVCIDESASTIKDLGPPFQLWPVHYVTLALLRPPNSVILKSFIVNHTVHLDIIEGARKTKGCLEMAA